MRCITVPSKLAPWNACGGPSLELLYHIAIILTRRGARRSSYASLTPSLILDGCDKDAEKFELLSDVYLVFELLFGQIISVSLTAIGPSLFFVYVLSGGIS